MTAEQIEETDDIWTLFPENPIAGFYKYENVFLWYKQWQNMT